MKKFFKNTENLDTDLNLVPIIDCFIMLICFLLFTVAFTQLVHLEIKIAKNTLQAMEQSRSELEKFHLVVTLEDWGFQMELSGTDVKSEKWKVLKEKGEYDYKKLHAKLIQIKSQYPDRFSIDIGVGLKGDHIIYEQVIKTVDAARHLTNEEFFSFRTAEKKIRALQLSEEEAFREVPELILQLAKRRANNKVASNADPKVLFPDIALVGIK